MKKWFAALLAIVMMFGMSSVSLAEDKPVITMINRLPASYVVEDNPVLAKVEEICGIELELEAPPINNYADRVNVVMASGEMPDLLYYQTDSQFLPIIEGWVEDGLVLCLDDYKDQLPTAMSVLDETALTVASIYDEEGRCYGLTRVQTKPCDAFIVRQDWLDNLGIEGFTTAEEFAQVMHAFTYDDPDGNGINDTYGFTLKGPYDRQVDRQVIYSFGVVPSTVRCEDGQFHCIEDQPGYMDYLDWLHDMYADGVINPEWYLAETYGDMDDFDAGKTGCFYATATTNHVARGPEVFATNPEMKVSALPTLRINADDAQGTNYYEPQMWGIWLVNADLADDPEHLAEVLKFLDWGYTDEANMLMILGLEGVTYDTFDEVTRVAVKGEATVNNSSLYTASYATFNFQLQDKGMLVRSANSAEEGQMLYETDAKLHEQTNIVPYVKDAWIPGVLSLQADMAEMTADRNDMVTKYICGTITRDEFTTYLQETWIPAQQPIMDIITAFFAE